MGDVVRWPGITTLDTSPRLVLTFAMREELENCIVLGFKEDGGIYLASSVADGGSMLWLMEIAKTRLMALAGEPQ
jgi:hypothetical protein